MTLIVCPLSQVERLVAERAPSHLITLMDPASLIATPAGLAPEHHLKVGINDIVEAADGLILAAPGDIAGILAFGEAWDGERPLLIHCWAGISRSTATAFVIACARAPETPEIEIAQALRRASPWAFPNRRIVALADAHLGREGRMNAAVTAIGPGALAAEGRPFDLPVAYP